MEQIPKHRDPSYLSISSKTATKIPGDLLNTDIPHYPLLVEQIPWYISHEDYNGFIRTIQVAGEIIPETGRRATIVTLTSGRTNTFPLSLKELTMTDVYVEKSPNVFSTVWEMHPAFKVFGRLEDRKGEVVLEVKQFVPIENVTNTLKVMSSLTKIAKYKYDLFGHSIRDNMLIKSYWEAAKINGKRVSTNRRDKDDYKKSQPSGSQHISTTTL